MEHTAHALVYSGPGRAEIAEVALPPMAPGMIEIVTAFSALSRGTERLVFNGRVPRGEWDRMRAPMQTGGFPFPVRYGYAAVGQVVAGPADLIGRDVFALHPHQDRFRVPAEAVQVLPGDVPPARAVLAANAETALNAVWDAGLCPATRCLVVGAGLLGWLVTALLSRRGDLTVDVTDIAPETGGIADDFQVTFVSPGAVAPEAYDVAFHCSASGAGLQTALDALDFEGRVIELSWYGDRPVTISLGGNFHANRLRIIASQVGHVAPARRASTSLRARLGAAIATLDDPRLDGLITADVGFRDLPAALPDLLGDGAPGIATRIVYG